MDGRLNHGHSETESLQDTSMIGTSNVREHKPERPLIDLESAPMEEGIDALMTTSSAPSPPPQ